MYFLGYFNCVCFLRTYNACRILYRIVRFSPGKTVGITNIDRGVFTSGIRRLDRRTDTGTRTRVIFFVEKRVRAGDVL